MRILLIRPIVSEVPDSVVEREVAGLSRVGLSIEARRLNTGPPAVEDHVTATEAARGVVELARAAEAEGYDAAAIYCFADPGLEAARQTVRIPVAGAGESSILIASSLGTTFSVVTVVDGLVSTIYNTVSRLSLGGRLASIRSVGIPVLELGDAARLEAALQREAVKAVEEDGAHVVVLGCTGMTGAAADLRSFLEDRGFRIPVVDPAQACVKWAEMLAGLGLTHSAKTYPLVRNTVSSRGG